MAKKKGTNWPARETNPVNNRNRFSTSFVTRVITRPTDT